MPFAAGTDDREETPRTTSASIASDPPHPRSAILGRLPRMFGPGGAPIRVLLVDDERALTELVKMALKHEGWVVETVHDGAAAVAAYTAFEPDVVVLDIMLPGLDGLRILERIRASGRSAPVLFLTARDTVADRVVGLTSGGDDYMTKPFSLEELVARLRGLIRRTGESASPVDVPLTVGDLTLDPASRDVTRAGDRIDLTTTEFELLRFMMRHPRRALERRHILKEVWNYDFEGRTSVVDLYISYLRKKIDAGREPMIHTVRGLGYQLRPAL